MLNPTTAVDVLVGALMPLVIALINQAHWSAKVKGVVALVVCALVAAGINEVRGTLNWHDWRATAVLVTGSALAMYHLWWRPTTWGPTVEAATTIAPPTGPPAAP